MRSLQTPNAPINKARCLYYDFFSRLFLYDLLQDSQKELLSACKLIQKSPLDISLQSSCQTLIEILENDDLQTFKQAYTKLFIMSLDKEPVHLLLSHYTSQNIGGDILLNIKAFFRQLTVRPNQDFCKESEEHFGFLLLLMGYLIAHEDIYAQELFLRFIAPFGIPIASALKQSSDKVYTPIGDILEHFIQFEINYYDGKES